MHRSSKSKIKVRAREDSPGERVRKLKAMLARGTMVSMQLSPLVSMKSCRVMAVGSMWCSLKGRMKACGREQTPVTRAV